MIGCGNLIDGLYKLELDNSYVESLITVNNTFGMKKNMNDERSAYLWHKR
jgi:hypothetical protein